MSRVADKLHELVAELGNQEQEMLLAFAEFLLQRSSEQAKSLVKKQTAVPQPKQIKRPENESVIKAIKRLTSSYHMLDKSKILQDTYALMLQHNMEGKPAEEVIDELEKKFLEYYQELQKGG